MFIYICVDYSLQFCFLCVCVLVHTLTVVVLGMKLRVLDIVRQSPFAYTAVSSLSNVCVSLSVYLHAYKAQ